MKLNKTTSRTAPLLVLLLLVAGAATVAPAAALKVSGARIALDIMPGQTVTSPIGISIGTNEAEGDYAIEVLGFGQSIADGTYTGLAASADTGTYTARPFITVDKPTVHLTPGGSADVTATIAVPASARDGGRYAIILVHPATSSSGAPAAFTTAVAIPVLLTVKDGTIDEKGEIIGIETSPVEISKPFTVTSTLWNSGNYHYYGIVANVTITNSAGVVVATAKTSPMSRAIVPGQQVKAKVTVAQGLAEGMYRMTVTMETQDGAVLDTETKSLQVGTPASGGTTGNSGSAIGGTEEAGAKTTYSPGPGVPVVCLAAAIGLLAGIRIRRKRE